MVTITDIAVLAETSVATISRVINGDPHVSEATRKKIMEVISATGYVPRRSNKHESRNKRIMVMLPSLSNPYFYTVLRGVEHKASACGYDTLSCVTHRNYAVEKRYLKMLTNKQVDGVILFTSSLSDRELNVLAGEYSIIQCGAIAEGSNISYVAIDDMAASYDAVSYLISLGNQKIAVISFDSSDLPFVKNRHTGYINALNDHALPYRPAYEISCDNNYTDSYQCMTKLMSLPEKPTAVFTFSDLTALGVLNYMHDHHLIPGKDIDVLGFDGTFLSECISPKLSVIQQPAYELGRTAFNMLLDKISTPDYITQKIILAHRLIPRETTRKQMKTSKDNRKSGACND